MTLLDTSVLVESLTGERRSFPQLRKFMESGELLLVPSLVMYEWLRGPRTLTELADQEKLFPTLQVLPFEAADSTVAARIYSRVSRARGREIDIAIAACAITRKAALWTLNPGDFRDIPGLTLAQPD